MRTFVIGDVHGEYKALMQCLERSKFENQDLLISLGDICGRGVNTVDCIDKLINIPNKICIIGNHDEIFYSWIQNMPDSLENSYMDCEDLMLADQITIKEYFIKHNEIPLQHKKFFSEQILYYVDKKNRLFVHGGFNRHVPISEQSKTILTWDRDLWYASLCYSEILKADKYPFKIYDKFSEIFIGHTSTINWNTDKPMRSGNIWNIDTGSGYNNGRLTIMNVDTKEYWQSDKT